MKVELSDEERQKLIAVLQDHRECLRREDYPRPDGRFAVEYIREHGVEVPDPEDLADEIDCKAGLLFELDGLIEKLGGC